MKLKLILLFLSLCGCATRSRCGDLVEARTVYYKDSSCQIRIRQVTVGSDLKIPESLKNPDIAGMELQWVEAGVVGGQIIFGHFIIAPQGLSDGNKK